MVGYLYRQPFAPLSSSPFQDLNTPFRAHSGSKSMRARYLDVTRLVGSLHRSTDPLTELDKEINLLLNTIRDRCQVDYPH